MDGVGTKVPSVEQRFAKAIEQYQDEQTRDKRERDDARDSAKRAHIIAVVSLVAMVIFGLVAFSENASIKEHKQDHYFGVPENSQGVQTGAAFKLTDIGSPTEAEVTRDLAVWANNAWAVATDPTARRHNYEQTYLFLDGTALTLYNTHLAVNGGANSPEVLGKTRSITVRVTKDAQLPGSMTWDLQWQDTMFQQPGGNLLNITNSMRISRCVNDWTMRRKSSRLRASRSILWTMMVSPARTNALMAWNCGRRTSLPEALSVNVRSS